MNKRDIAVEVLKTHLGLPYKWGGDDTIGGFDCSGLVIDVLKSAGIIVENKDYTAEGLSKLYEETDVLLPGSLVFYDWNKDGIEDHVEMIAFTDEDGNVFTIGASGGGSATTSPQSAMEQNAYVKVRPMRSGYTLVTDPFKTQ